MKKHSSGVLLSVPTNNKQEDKTTFCLTAAIPDTQVLSSSQTCHLTRLATL